MPASTLSGRSVALLRVNLGDYTSEGQSISHGNCTRIFQYPEPPRRYIAAMGSGGACSAKASAISSEAAPQTNEL